MLQKLGFAPGFNKQVTEQVPKGNGLMVTSFVLDMEAQKK